MPRVRAGKGEEGNVARKAKRRRKKRRDAVVAGLTELVDEAQGISKEDLEEGQTMINEMGEQWGKVGATGEDLRHRAYQLLLYCDTAGHSDRQTKQLLRLVKHPFLTSSLLLKHKKTVTETVVEQFRLKGSADRQSASVDFDAVMSYFYELLKDSKLVEGEDSNKLKEIHLALGGDGRKTGANLRSVVLAAKLFPVDVNGKPLAPMPTPTSQDALFPLLIAKCNEKQEELEVVCQDVLRRLEKVQDAGGWKHPTTGVTLPTIKLFVIGDMKWLLECTGHKYANSKDFCMYCFCREENRYDLTTKHTITRLSNFKQGEAGKKHDKSLFHFIPIEQHLPDLLHMMLRVSGRFAAALIREIIEGMPKTPWLGGEPLTEEWRNHEDRVREFERLLRNDPIPGAAGGARPRGPGSRVVSGVKIRWNDDLQGGRGDYEWTGFNRIAAQLCVLCLMKSRMVSLTLQTCCCQAAGSASRSSGSYGTSSLRYLILIISSLLNRRRLRLSNGRIRQGISSVS
eukprot:g64686.t1